MSPRRAPVDRSLRRKVGVRRPRKTLLVFCEGRRTEPEYLEALRRVPTVRDSAAVEIRIERASGGCAPLTLVQMAAEAMEAATAETAEIDEFWCVFDVEQPQPHPNLREALEFARSKDISVAVSNPCFELWLALHHQDRTA